MKQLSYKIFFKISEIFTSHVLKIGKLLKYRSKPIYVTILLIFGVLTNVAAQPYIHCNTILNHDENTPSRTNYKVKDGVTYLVYSTSESDLPLINGTPYSGGEEDIYISIWDAGCNQVLGTYYGGTGTEIFEDFLLDNNGNIVIRGRTQSADLPTTDGTSIGPDRGQFLMSLNSTGTLNYATIFLQSYLLGTGPSERGMIIEGNRIYHIAETSSYTVDLFSHDVTTGSLLSQYTPPQSLYGAIYSIPSGGFVVNMIGLGGGTTDGTSGSARILIFDDLGNLLVHTALSLGEFKDVTVDETGIYCLMEVSSSDIFPSTDGTSAYDPGSVFFPGTDDIGVIKYDLSGNIVYATLLGSTSNDTPGQIEVQNGMVYMLNGSDGGDFQVVNGTSLPSGNVMTKLNPDGTINYSTYYASREIQAVNAFFALNPDGEVFLFSEVDGPSVLTTTDGTSGIGTNIAKFDSNGFMEFSSTYNVGYISSANEYTVSGDTLTLILGAGGSFAPTNFSTDGTADDGTTFQGDISVARFVFCPPAPSAPSDVLSPVTMNGCINGVLEQIIGEEIPPDGGAIPVVYDNGVPVNQVINGGLEYQWQYSLSNPSGTPDWQDVTGGPVGQQQNYTPPPTSQDVWYRRITKTSEACGEMLVSTSSISFVDIDDSVSAPMPDAGGQFYTCPGETIDLGNPDNNSVTGGTSPYTYTWSNGETTPTQSVTVSQSTVYTLTVTDANGCEQVDQARVDIYQAEAGPFRNICGGETTQLGGSPLAGIPIVDLGSPIADAYSIAYTWSPTTDLSDPNVPNPTTSTGGLYTLAVTIYQPDGSSCESTDIVFVNTVTEPSNPNFAGRDTVICAGETFLLGTPAEPGYNYIWTPGANITDANIAQPTFDAGTTIPSPDPITYTVTANNGNCNYFDQVSVYVIEARADIDGCGPRTIGEPDRTPNIDETYSWEIIASDPGTTSNFIGPTDQAVTTVSGNSVGSTTYELTTTFVFNGETFTCTDQVVVPPCGCIVVIEADTDNCLDYDLNGSIKLTATATADDLAAANPNDFIYEWSPEAGLDTYTGREVFIQDNVDRTYTVTATSTIDPTFSCSETIQVNNPANAEPVFTAPSPVVTCPGDPVNIGNPATNPGLSYSWNPSEFLNNPNLSYPEATVNETTEFSIRVTDVATGCYTTENVIVDVGLSANAGEDVYVCDNGTVAIGSPAILGYTYSWEPTGADWRDDMNVADPTQVSQAQPNVFVSTLGGAATSQVFTLTTTSPEGCISTDEVTVYVNPLPDPVTLTDLDFCPTTPPVVLGYDNLDGTGTNQVPLASSYNWSPGALLVDPSAQNPTLAEPLPNAAVTFKVQIINGGGCNQIAEQTLTPTGVDIPAVQPATICVGEPTNIGSDSNSTSLSWTPDSNNPPGASLDDASSPNPEFTSTTTGSFTYTVTSGSVCPGTAEVTITVLEVNAPTVVSPTICEGQSVVIGPEPEPGLSYGWSPATGLSDSGIAQPTFSGTSSQNYTLTIFNSIGCSVEVPMGVTVSSNSIPLVAITDTVRVCLSDQQSVLLDATVTPADDYNYEWTPSEFLNNTAIEDPTLLIPDIGNYTYDLVVTSQTTGCSSANDGIDVTVIAGRIDNCLASANNNLLAGGKTLELFAEGESNDAYSWTGPNGFTSTEQNPVLNNFTGENAGTYFVTRTNTEGCSVNCSVDVALLPNFDLALQKVLSVGQMSEVVVGDDVSFTISVFNQGTVDATNIEVLDYIPTNMTYAVSGQTPSGTLTTTLSNTVNFTNNGGGSFTLVELAAGDAVSFDIVLTVGTGATGILINNAEIIAADGGTDEDSPLSVSNASSTDMIGANEIDNDIADDNNGGMDTAADEDDWDYAQVNLCINPMITVSTTQTSCNPDGTSNTDGHLLLTAVTGDATHYNFSSGSSYTGPTDITSATAFNPMTDLPLEIGNLSNPIGSQDYTLRIFNGLDGCFVDEVVVLNEQLCFSCNLTNAGNTLETCNDNGTVADETDDYITFSLNPTGSDLGTTYTVTVDNGGTINLVGGGAATGINYGVATDFRLQNGSANGSTNYTITVTDDTDANCQITTSVMQDNCAIPCPTITNPTSAQIICEGQTISNLSINTDATTSNIEFVYFSTQQTGNAMYTGGTTLGLVSPISGVASISNVGFPGAGTYYVYTILSPTPVNATCRPNAEIIVNVDANPSGSLTVSDTTICTETDALVWVYNSEVGVNYQLRRNGDDSFVGSAVAGTGNAISFPVSSLIPAGSYTFNVLATANGTTCSNELTDLAEVTVEDCDFTINFPDCELPPCHFISSDIYLGSGVNAESGSSGENQNQDDGITFPNNIRPNVNIRIPVTMFNNTGSTAYLSAWIDWNGDGDFTDAGEQIASETYPSVAPNTGSFQVSLPTTVPSNAVQDSDIRVRFRLSTDDSIQFSPCGVQSCAGDGEVEDYVIQVECPPTICVPVQIQINRGE